MEVNLVYYYFQMDFIKGLVGKFGSGLSKGLKVATDICRLYHCLFEIV